MKRTTIFLPDECHERLRREAFRLRISMAELIRRRLEERPQPASESDDPLLEAAGIGAGGGLLTENLDEQLYGL